MLECEPSEFVDLVAVNKIQHTPYEQLACAVTMTSAIFITVDYCLSFITITVVVNIIIKTV